MKVKLNCSPFSLWRTYTNAGLVQVRGDAFVCVFCAMRLTFDFCIDGTNFWVVLFTAPNTIFFICNGITSMIHLLPVS